MQSIDEWIEKKKDGLLSNQRQYLEGVEWLILSGCGSGKTHLLVVAMLIAAAKRLGVWIHVWNHSSSSEGLHPMLQEASRLIEADAPVTIEFKNHKKAFRLLRKEETDADIGN